MSDSKYAVERMATVRMYLQQQLEQVSVIEEVLNTLGDRADVTKAWRYFHEVMDHIIRIADSQDNRPMAKAFLAEALDTVKRAKGE